MEKSGVLKDIVDVDVKQYPLADVVKHLICACFRQTIIVIHLPHATAGQEYQSTGKSPYSEAELHWQGSCIQLQRRLHARRLHESGLMAKIGTYNCAIGWHTGSRHRILGLLGAGVGSEAQTEEGREQATHHETSAGLMGV